MQTLHSTAVDRWQGMFVMLSQRLQCPPDSWICPCPPINAARPPARLPACLPAGIVSVAVVLKHAAIFPEHEQQVGRLARDMGFQQVGGTPLHCAHAAANTPQLNHCHKPLPQATATATATATTTEQAPNECCRCPCPLL